MPRYDSTAAILKSNVDPVGYAIGDEIWQIPLAEAVRSEAEKTAYHFPATIAKALGHDHLVALLADEMTGALRAAGDTHTAVDGVIYSLAAADATPAMTATLSDMVDEPVVVEAAFQQADYGPRIAIVRWSDGTTSEALRFYSDELLVCEGDLIGKTQEQIRALHHRRDREWLQS